MVADYIHNRCDDEIPYPGVQLTGTEVADHLLGMDHGPKRDDWIVEKYLEGHIPSPCRRFHPVTKDFTGGVTGTIRRVTYWYTGEYLSLGTDDDYVRCPLSPLSAQVIADVLGLMLPTVSMVDMVWRDANIRLKPLPWGPPYDASMMSSQRFIEHSRRIDRQVTPLGLDTLQTSVAGHKKDVVVDNVLEANVGSVAIYGWHMPNGRPIQQLYTGHENTYRDYSHGIRFIDLDAWLESEEGEWTYIDVRDAMVDGELWPAFGSEPQHVWRQPGV